MSLNVDEFLVERHAAFAQELGAHQKTPPTRPRKSIWRRSIGIFVGLVIVLIVAIALISRPAKDFPTGERVRIERGSSVDVIARSLSEAGMIRSQSMFTLWASLSGNADALQAGDYVFEEPLGARGITKRMAAGDHGEIALRLTILEGSTLDDIASAAEDILEDFDRDLFIDQAIEFNGYLFPDTYFLVPGTTEEELIERMHDRFSEVFNEVGSNVLNTITPEELREVVIMASIIQREAAGANDAYTISGILWKRIEIGMPLQVDASFAYLFGKDSSQVTRSDFDFDSPFNTYKYAGLPPGPLGNPGKIALDAALHPASSPYLYFLHDPRGNTHYGETLDDHNNNKNRYLR